MVEQDDKGPEIIGTWDYDSQDLELKVQGLLIPSDCYQMDFMGITFNSKLDEFLKQHNIPARLENG